MKYHRFYASALVFALMTSSTVARSKTDERSENVPALAGERDFGHMSLNDVKTHVFKIENPDTKAITIDSVECDSPIVSIEKFSQKIPPGGSGEVAIVLMPEKAGRFDAVVAARSTDGKSWLFRARGEVGSPSSARSDGEKKTTRSSYTIGARELAALVEAGKVKIVDVRSAEEFRECHIPGSFNMSLFSLKAKTWLKAGKIALVREAFDDAGAEKAARSSREAGFDAVFLKGGVKSWAAEGLETVGSFSSGVLDLIKPIDFYKSIGGQKWVVVDMLPRSRGADGGETVKSDPPNQFVNKYSYNLLRSLETVGYPVEKPSDIDSGSLDRVLAKLDPKAKILFFDRNGTSYHILRKKLKKHPELDVFFLKGGMAGFNMFANKFLSGRTTKIKRISSSSKSCGCGK